MLLFYRYIAAVIQGHVVPTIPYISDAATYSPESCVFAQFINIGCVLCKNIFRKMSQKVKSNLFLLQWVWLFTFVIVT